MQSIGEVSSVGGMIFKLIKTTLIFSAVSAVLIVETHLFGFGITNLFVNEYNFQLKPMNSNYIAHGYNNFLFFVSEQAIKMPLLVNLAVILVVPSFVYISFFHSKSKIFPRVIVGTIINNTIAFLVVGFLVQLTSKLIGVYATVLYFIPVVYAVYLINFKGKIKINKSEKFISIKDSGKNEGFILKTESGDIHLKNPYRGILIQGGAGSGKSASLFEPIIQQIGEKDYTGILYDFKSPELTNKLIISYKNSKVLLRNVDFKHPNLSDRVNPIDTKYLTKSAVAIEYVQVLINNLIPETIKKNDYWTNNAKMILAGVIWYLRNEHPKYCTLPHAISLILHSSVDELIQKVCQNYESGGMVASLRESIERGSEKTVAGMLSTLQNALSVLNSQDVFWILSGNDVDLHLNNPQNPTFLCLGNDSTLPQVYSPIISLITAVSLRQMNRPGQNKSIILLDEAPTIFIPNIEQSPATGRSNKIATVFGIQDYSQLVDRYGQDKSQVIISNLGNQFFGRTTNLKTAEMVQGLFSKSDKVFVSKSEGSGTSGKFIHLGSNRSDGTSENIQERDRVKVNDLIHLSSGEFYGIIAEGSPREFLSTKFKKWEIEEDYINQRIPVSNDMMKDNYFKIINECKGIFS